MSGDQWQQRMNPELRCVVEKTRDAITAAETQLHQVDLEVVVHPNTCPGITDLWNTPVVHRSAIPVGEVRLFDRLRRCYLDLDDKEPS